jgi:hypothetical protein
LVHFLQSDVNLPGLPEKHVLLTPIDYSFTTKILGILTESNKPKRVRVKMQQADYEIGFAVTGHSAQGETLPVVVTDLNIGGSAAYVSASCPTTRDGLILLKEVDKSALNKPSPPELLLESRRLEALEHNTKVRFKFLNEPLVEVPDAEHTLGFEANLRNLRFSVSNNKRKAANDPKGSSLKRQKIPINKLHKKTVKDSIPHLHLLYHPGTP